MRAFAAQRPQDPFPRYGLGMEMKGLGDLSGAWAIFEAVMAEHPDYVACYGPAGEVLVALGRVQEARGIYARGIEACTRKGDSHLGANLEDALAALAE